MQDAASACPALPVDLLISPDMRRVLLDNGQRHSDAAPTARLGDSNVRQTSRSTAQICGAAAVRL